MVDGDPPRCRGSDWPCAPLIDNNRCAPIQHDCKWRVVRSPHAREQAAACLFRIQRKRNPVMKGLSVIGLLFAAAIVATVPLSPQVTSRGLELSVDQAQAQTYGRYRRVTRRTYRRSYRYARRSYRQSYRYARLGASAAPGYYGARYRYRAAYGFRQVWVSPNRLCTIYPSGFHWCWTYF
jgi:hypothetical protein